MKKNDTPKAARKPKAASTGDKTGSANPETENAAAGFSFAAETYRHIFNSAAVGMSISDVSGKLIDLNESLCRMLGYTKEELLKMRVADITHPEDVESTRFALDAVFSKKQKTVELEKRYVKKDGSLAYGRVHLFLIKENGATFISAVIEDITGHVEAEAKMRMLAAAVESSIDGIAVASVADGTVRFTNKAWADMHGLDREEAIGQPHAIFHTAEQVKTDVIPFDEVLVRKGWNKGEMGHARADGTTFPTWMTVTRIDGVPGEQPYYVAIARDITNRKKADAELRQHRDNLEEMVASRTNEMIAAILHLQQEITERKITQDMLVKTKQEAEFYLDLMSHDLTNFSQTALGFLSLMENKTEPTPQQIKYIDYCRRQMAKCENLIAKVRAFSTVKNLDGVEFGPVNLERLIAESAATVKNLYPHKNIRVFFEPAGGKYGIGTDLLESVFMNIIENAAKHIRLDEIKLSIDIRPTESETGEKWEVTISDNGPGVPDEMKSAVFDRYARIGSEKGMGLGLSLSRAILDKFSGGIRVEDRVDEQGPCGSSFVISIPKSDPPAGEAENRAGV